MIEVSDSDDEVVVVAEPKGKGKAKEYDRARDAEVEVNGEGDEALARRLAEEWAQEDAAKEELVELEASAPVPRPSTPPRIHPLFAKPEAPTTPKVEAKPQLSGSPAKAGPSAPRSPATFASRPHAAVSVVDFDTDDLLFRPDEVDISAWPGGRLPYAVLVGVYVQVAATRSRLTIVRVLTK